MKNCASHRRWQLSGVAFLVAMTLLIMLMASERMAILLLAFPPLRQAIEWLEGWPLPLDIPHVVFFAFLGIAMRTLVPRLHWGWLLLGLGALAATTELLQFGAVGRSPRMTDIRDDLIGAGIGLLVAGWWITSARRFLHRRPAAPSSL